MNRKQSIDILAIITITMVAVVAVAIAPDGSFVRVVTLPLVLILPGYALTTAIFPLRLPGFPERLVFSLGFSLVVVIVSGLALNWKPFGLRADSWLVFLCGIILGSCGIAHIRRRGQSIAVSQWSEVKDANFTSRQWLLLGLAVLVIGTALVVSCVGAAQQPRSGFTQLWIMPASDIDPQHVVRFGVSNREHTTMDYRLVVNVNSKRVQVWSFIDLKTNENWQAVLALPKKRYAGTARIEAMLYRASAPTKIYRQAVLWLGT